MDILKREPVAVAVAAVSAIEAIIGLLMALAFIPVAVGAALISIVTASLVLIRQVVTPVGKVASLLDKPIEIVNDVLKDVVLP